MRYNEQEVIAVNNYELSRDRAQKYFLGFDQESIIRTWGLDADTQPVSFQRTLGAEQTVHGVYQKRAKGVKCQFRVVVGRRGERGDFSCPEKSEKFNSSVSGNPANS